MKYTVGPVTRINCDCPDCRAGKHLYELNVWRDDEWSFVGVSLQNYPSAASARNHQWGIEFKAGDTWEDGTPIPPSEPTEKAAPSTGRTVLDMEAAQKSFEALEKHWLNDPPEADIDELSGGRFDFNRH
jgi:hypothetical protein